MRQYNTIWTISLVYVLKPLINVIRAIKTSVAACKYNTQMAGTEVASLARLFVGRRNVSQWALCMIPSRGKKPVMLDDKRMQQPPKTKWFPSAKHDFSLLWMSHCVACHPAGQILPHVTASWKGPIQNKSSYCAHCACARHDLVWRLTRRMKYSRNFRLKTICFTNSFHVTLWWLY